MKVMRMMEQNINRESGFRIGDKIQVGKYMATCQKVEKKRAIFCMDQYLDNAQVMNQQRTNEGGYDDSDLRKFLKELAMNVMFDEIREMMIPFKNGDLLRIPTAEEMFGPDKAYNNCEHLVNNEKQWPLMRDRHNRIAFRGEDHEFEEWGWLQNKHRDTISFFALVDLNGGPDFGYASDAVGVRVVFQLKK